MISESVVPDEKVPVIPEEVAEIPAVEIESITPIVTPIEGSITPIDVIENIKLESYVNKTIVNDNNVVEVPMYEEKDKMLEEVKKMISEPPQELTTVEVPLIETTTLLVTTETTTEQQSTTTVAQIHEHTTKSPIMHVVTLTPAPETETIFDPIIAGNNENINEENLSLLTTTESSTRVSLWTELPISDTRESLAKLFQRSFLLFHLSSKRKKVILINFSRVRATRGCVLWCISR